MPDPDPTKDKDPAQPELTDEQLEKASGGAAGAAGTTGSDGGEFGGLTDSEKAVGDDPAMFAG